MTKLPNLPQPLWQSFCPIKGNSVVSVLNKGHFCPSTLPFFHFSFFFFLLTSSSRVHSLFSSQQVPATAIQRSSSQIHRPSPPPPTIFHPRHHTSSGRCVTKVSPPSRVGEKGVDHHIFFFF